MNKFDEEFIKGIGVLPCCHYLYLKRALDVLIAGLLIIMTSPIIMFSALLIKVTSKGPALYRQTRVGINGKIIIITKLRSMYIEAEQNGAQWAEKNDPRITLVGKFLRKTRIDELPQLLSVVKGDMSLIGPRPERPQFTLQFSNQYRGFQRRLRIKPGLSGYAQVHGGYELKPDEKAELDNFYIDHLSFWGDVRIAVKTIIVVLSGEGAR